MPSDRRSAAPAGQLASHARSGLAAPICLTWELTYACNLSCIHCLSASGRRDPAELTTSECKRVLDELAAMQVFYINVGGGEPTVLAPQRHAERGRDREAGAGRGQGGHEHRRAGRPRRRAGPRQTDDRRPPVLGAPTGSGPE